MPSYGRDDGPYKNGAAITPSDTVAIAGGPCTGVWVGGAGVVAVVFASGASPVNFTCVAGSYLPVRAFRINSTNTTATLLVALYP